MPPVDVNRALSRAFKDEGAHIRGALMRAIGDFAIVDDAVAAAAEQALLSWPTGGIPDRPGAWLTTVAKKKAIDVLRRKKRLADKIAVIARLEEEPPDVSAVAAKTEIERRDDSLRLLFVSCHPSLPEDERVALTLQVVGGLSAAEIARAFLVPVTAMEKRLARAKHKLKGVPFEVPPADEIHERLAAVLAVIYLVFNEGYLASKGDAVIRHELCAEAIRIARLLRSLVPATGPGGPEVTGLLALLLLTHARRDARVDEAGELILLEQQDRSCWDRELIDQGVGLIDDVLLLRRPGPYQIQAAIAALHAQARDAAETDWPQIAALYAALVRFVPTPVVRLNHAVGVAMAHGMDAGLSLVDALGKEGDLDDYHLYWSTRGELFRRKGDRGAARRAFQRARTLSPSEAEKALLARRLAELD